MDPDILLELAMGEDWVSELALLTHLLLKEETRVLNQVFDLDSFKASECDEYFPSIFD